MGKLSFNGKKLMKYKAKNGGKNHSQVDGFYRDVDGNEYFIKQPADKKELFTELFAGLLLKEFMARGLIEERFRSSLICADCIQFNDGSYGLIQPKVNFTELFKLLKTGNSDNSDRDLWKEIWNGPFYYQSLAQQKKCFGLSTSLMFSLLLGAYSVHSGNIVALDLANAPHKQYARIDWGDSFRHFAYAQNNRDILCPSEYSGMFNLKRLTKGYIQNYKNIPGLFPAIARKALKLKDNSSDEQLFEIVKCALKNLPGDLLDFQTQQQLAVYMGIPQFKMLNSNDENSLDNVAISFARILSLRIPNIAGFVTDYNTIQKPSKKAYPRGFFGNRAVVTPGIETSNPVLVNPEFTFFEQLNAWHETLQEMVDNSCTDFDFTQCDIDELTKQYNDFVEFLANSTEARNFWEHPTEENTNLLAPYFKRDIPEILPYYRESTILSRICTMDPAKKSKKKFAHYEIASGLYCQSHQGSSWHQIKTALDESLTVLNSIRRIRNEAKASLNPADIKQLISMMKHCSTTINEIAEVLLELKPAMIVPQYESPFFYPIDDQLLKEMTGNQLLTICAEELSAEKFSPLVQRIVNNRDLWDKLNSGTEKSIYKEQITILRQWRLVSLRREEFASNTELKKKQDCFEQLYQNYQQLPLFLRTDPQFTHRLESERTELSALEILEQAHGGELDEFTRSSLLTGNQISEEGLETIFYALPLSVQENYTGIEEYKRTHQYYTKIVDFARGSTLADKLSAFNELSKNYNDLPAKSDSVQRSFKIQQKKTAAYDHLLKHNYLPPEFPITKIDPILNSIWAQDKSLSTASAVMNDEVFWCAIQAADTEVITAEQIRDCLALKQFHDEKIQLNKSKEFGQVYERSIHQFYEISLQIRLSDAPAVEQGKAIITNARAEFIHRHGTERFVADVIMVLSFFLAGLGLYIGLGRHALNGNFFFSHSETQREQDIKDLLENGLCRDDEKENESSLNLSK